MDLQLLFAAGTYQPTRQLLGKEGKSNYFPVNDHDLW